MPLWHHRTLNVPPVGFAQGRLRAGARAGNSLFPRDDMPGSVSKKLFALSRIDVLDEYFQSPAGLHHGPFDRNRRSVGIGFIGNVLMSRQVKHEDPIMLAAL